MTLLEFELCTRVIVDGLFIGSMIGIILTTFRMFFAGDRRAHY